MRIKPGDKLVRVKEYPETHQVGMITLENMPQFPIMQGDLGIRISRDGRVWVCINGIAFIRFSPHLNGRMTKENREA